MGRKLEHGVNDLATTHPELAEEWDYEENKGLKDKNGRDISTPDKIMAGSRQKIWWKCQRGHCWDAAPADRIRGRGCPYCAGLYAIPNETDLKFLFPEIAAEWHPTKNEGLTSKYGRDISTPDKITANSRQKVWWRCLECGNEWESSVSSRTNGHGCSKCSNPKHKNSKSGHNNGNNTSFGEQSVYYYIKKYFTDALNGDREILNGKELDIYIPSLKTGIEYDGALYHQDVEKDLEKNKLALKKGIRLIRLRENKCPVLADDSIEYIIRSNNTVLDLEKTIKILLIKLDVKSLDIDINRDYSIILNQINLNKKEKSLIITHPELVKEWHPTKNGKLSPDNVTYGSSIKVWWKCPVCGHEWQTTVSNRAISKRNCPRCAVSQLSVADIQNILDLLKTTNYTCAFIGEMFGVHSSTISQINIGLKHRSLNEKYPIRKTRIRKTRRSKTDKIQPPSYCQICGKQLKERRAKYCQECAHMLSRKALRPTPVELAKMVKESSFTSVGKHFGVTDNTIKKWCKQYGIPHLKKDLVSWYEKQILNN